MGHPVSPSIAASFRSHELPRDQAPNTVAQQFVAWWRERAETEQLDPPDVDFAADVLRSVLDSETYPALLSELLESLPFDLTWKATVLLRTSTASAAALEALRQLVMAEPFDARDNVAGWLIERDALGVAELGLLLEDPNVRGLAARALEACSVEALRPLSAVLARFAAAEKHKYTRRSLARLARKARGRQEASGAQPQLDAAALAARIQVDWDAGGNRAASREQLARLADTPDGSGLVQLLALQQRASSPSLRKACGALLDSALNAVDLGDALIAEVRRLPAGPERKPIEQLVAARLEQAMLGERPLDSVRLVALLAALGPRRALLVRTTPEGEPWFLTAGTSPLPDHVQLVHPATVAADALQALIARIARDKLVIPCDQVTRVVFRMAPDQQNEQRFELDVPSVRNPGRLLANGWRPADCESFDPHDRDYKAFSESTKLFASANVEARWEHTMMYPNSPDSVEPDNDEWLTFWDTSQPPRQLRLGQVSPVVFSELLRELTPKDARSRELLTKRTPHATKRVRAKVAPASNTACTDEICSLASSLASSPEGRADALRLVERLDERVQRLIEAFTKGEARSDDQACKLLQLTPGELSELTDLIRRTFAPALQR